MNEIGDPKPKSNKCKCCHGSGVQRNQKTGLIQHCPCCHGTGKNKRNKDEILPITW